MSVATCKLTAEQQLSFSGCQVACSGGHLTLLIIQELGSVRSAISINFI